MIGDLIDQISVQVTHLPALADEPSGCIFDGVDQLLSELPGCLLDQGIDFFATGAGSNLLEGYLALRKERHIGEAYRSGCLCGRHDDTTTEARYCRPPSTLTNMSAYNGPAVIIVKDDTEVAVIANLRNYRNGLRTGWGGRLTPTSADGLQ